MRAATTLAALIAAPALLFAVTGSGAGSEDLGAEPAAEGDGPRHQLLGSWKTGRSGRLEMARTRGLVDARVVRTADVAGCPVAHGTTLLRSLRFVRRDPEADVWVGRIALPDPRRDCRRRLVAVRVRIADDLRLRALYRAGGERQTLRLRRIRPAVRAGDPIVGTWKRRRVGFRVERRRGAFVGVARDAYLLSNNCTVPAGTVVWRLRPLAPGRYDGVVQTFLPPPGCGPAEPSPSRWRFEGDTLVREAPDGSLSEYARSSD